MSVSERRKRIASGEEKMNVAERMKRGREGLEDENYFADAAAASYWSGWGKNG